jgi:hypothetical protein
LALPPIVGALLLPDSLVLSAVDVEEVEAIGAGIATEACVWNEM